MSRQAIGLIVVLLLFVGLLVVRAGIGNGMGRVYSERESVAMVQVEIPILDVVEGDAEGTVGTESVWVPAASDDATDFANADSPRVEWQTTTPIKPGTYFQDSSNPAYELDWPRTIGIWVAAIFTLAIFSFLDSCLRHLQCPVLGWAHDQRLDRPNESSRAQSPCPVSFVELLLLGHVRVQMLSRGSRPRHVPH